MRNILVLTGLAGCGKSTVAEYMAGLYGFERVRFASPLKNMLRVLGLNEAEIEGHLKEEPCDKLGGVTPRKAMLTLGTEWGREMIGKNIWTDAFKRMVLGMSGNIVVEDCRFPNEVDICRSLGNAVVIRIERPGQTAASDPTHESETHVLPHDATVLNDMTKSVLCDRVYELFSANLGLQKPTESEALSQS